jgi:hypothetical protein
MGSPAFAAYRRDLDSGEMRAMALHVLDLRDGYIASITAFLDPSVLGRLGYRTGGRELEPIGNR